MARLGQITVPALVAAGDDDQITDLKGAEAMAAALPVGAFLSLPGVGHMPMFEDTAALGEALNTLIKRGYH